MKIMSLAGYLVMMGALVGLLYLRSLFSLSWIVISVQIAALLLLVWARITFGRRSFHVIANPTAGGLVMSGPYRYIRHPIYAALCWFTGAAVAAHLSWKTGLCFALMLGGALLRIFWEERLVTIRYPEYRDYAVRTWRMVPYLF
jgi:protein-S-isoprenylcysteine O-methyltransferase Ste14